MHRDKNNKKRILNRYGVVVVAMILLGVCILFSAGKIIFTPEGERWREVGERETVIRDRVILPTRGNIFTHDGKLLASSEPLYSIYMDFWADGMKKDTLVKYAEPLSKELSAMFGDRTSSLPHLFSITTSLICFYLFLLFFSLRKIIQ